MNKLSIIGNVARDPELRSVNTANGPVSVCDATVAVNDRRSRNQQNGQENTLFVRCTFWRQPAEIISRYVRKGHKLFVTGPVSVRTYQANDGSTRVSVEINNVEDFELLTSRAEAESMGNASGAYTAPAAAPAAPTMQNNGFTAVESDELPF